MSINGTPTEELLLTPGYAPTPTQRDNKEHLNDFLASGNLAPLRFTVKKPLEEAGRSTQFFAKKKGREVIDYALDIIAPGQSNLLLKMIVKPESENTVFSKELMTLVELYHNEEKWFTRQQILSTFACNYTLKQLLTVIPDLTYYRFTAARRHASLHGAGKSLAQPKITRQRLPPNKVTHFLEFIAAPHLLQDVAYGTRTMKLSTGEKLEVPNVVRTVMHSRIVQMYQAYCDEIEMECLGRSTLFELLRVMISLKYLVSFIPCVCQLGHPRNKLILSL